MKEVPISPLIRRLRPLAAPHRHARRVIEQVLVKVNGDIITKTELEKRQVAVLRAR